MKPRRDTGAGLVEVMVGVVIFSVVTGLLATFSVDMIRKGSGTTSRLGNTDQLRVAMDEISKGLRIAVRPEQLNPACTVACDVTFYAPTATSLAFYANHGDAAGPRLTTYRVEADPQHPGTGRLVATLRPAATPVALSSTSSTCATGCAERTLVRGLTWPVPAAPFVYAGASCATALAQPSAPGAVSPSVACVAVDLRTAGGRDYAGTSVTSTVFLPNSAIGR
ncbi:MAG: PilW family protein [Sporichthyaceae bacterium]